VQYLGANIPQAWAAGSIFLFIRTILGLRADAPRGRLYVDPTLPDWLPDVELRNLAVGQARLDLRFWREAERSRWELLGQQGDGIEVVAEGTASATGSDDAGKDAQAKPPGPQPGSSAGPAQSQRGAQ